MPLTLETATVADNMGERDAINRLPARMMPSGEFAARYLESYRRTMDERQAPPVSGLSLRSTVRPQFGGNGPRANRRR